MSQETHGETTYVSNDWTAQKMVLRKLMLSSTRSTSSVGIEATSKSRCRPRSESSWTDISVVDQLLAK